MYGKFSFRCGMPQYQVLQGGTEDMDLAHSVMDEIASTDYPEYHIFEKNPLLLMGNFLSAITDGI